MKGFLENGLGRWVAVCEFHPRTVFASVALLSTLIGAYVWQNFAIDSDLSKLIRPSDDLAWYQTDQAFKAAFPRASLDRMSVGSRSTACSQ